MNLKASQVQTQIASALEKLKLEGNSSQPGGPIEFQVTDGTLDFLKGKTIVVNSDGSVEVR